MPPLSSLFALHLAVALFGFAGLFGKWVTLPPTGIVFARTVIAALVLALVVAMQRRRVRLSVALAGNGVLLAVHWVTFFEAIRVSSVAIGLLGYATFPLFVLVVERVTLGRRVAGGEWVTALLVVTGLVVLVPTIDFADNTVRGLAWGLVSGITFALLTVRSRALAATHAPSAIALGQNVFAALALLPFVWLFRDTLTSITQRDIVLLLVLGIVCTALSHTLFIASLRRVSAHTASVVAALEPVYGIALAALLLNEIPTTRTLAGAALIIGAALHATRRDGV